VTSSPAIGPDARFEEFDRRRWAARATGTFGRPGVGPVSADELAEVYLPLADWLAGRLQARGGRAPYLVSVTGSVAVGKSASAIALQSQLEERPGTTVALLPTDSFLYPNAVLAERGLLERKGFPETFDGAGLAAAVEAIRAGQPEVAVPVYSHEAYDIVAGEHQLIRRPQVVILDGIYPLLPDPRTGGAKPTRSARCDLSIYVDAQEADIATWFTARLLRLVATTPTDAPSLYGRLAGLSPADLEHIADAAWTHLNLVNLRQHILPTRAEADLILWKDSDHRVQRVLERRNP
jgi:type I pantothenate kinase